MLQQALNAATVQEEEALWTQIIDKYSKMDANWVPDLVRRCMAMLLGAACRFAASGTQGAALCETVRVVTWAVLSL